MKLILTLIALACIASCNPIKQEERTKLDVKQKLITPVLKVYPPTSKFIKVVNPTSKLKVYFSLNFSCTTCIAKIQSLNALQAQLSNKNITLYIIGHSDDDFKLMEYLFKTSTLKNINFPIYLDHSGLFYQNNTTIQKNSESNILIIDSNNYILFDKDIFNSSKNLKEFSTFLNIES